MLRQIQFQEDDESRRFAGLLDQAPTAGRTVLWATALPTPLGLMMAVSDAEGLYLLEFLDRRHLEARLAKLRVELQAVILPGQTPMSAMLAPELALYFSGQGQDFKTPLHIRGSAFQKEAWAALLQIPYGEIWTYQAQATHIGRPTAYRAVANANGANPFCIVVPCHRVARSDGDGGGYAAGIARKKWLVQHERRKDQ